MEIEQILNSDLVKESSNILGPELVNYIVSNDSLGYIQKESALKHLSKFKKQYLQTIIIMPNLDDKYGSGVIIRLIPSFKLLAIIDLYTANDELGNIAAKYESIVCILQDEMFDWFNDLVECF